MRIWSRWSRCIKRIIHKQCNDSSNQDNNFYYEKKIYLGEKGILYSRDRKMMVEFLYSVRDGMWVKVKMVQPWRILFEYNDGISLIYDNDISISYVNWLRCIQDSLSQIYIPKKEMDVFSRLKRVIIQSIIENDIKDFDVDDMIR